MFENLRMTTVQDYCFLSDPAAMETFIVERSGRVRLWYENDAPVLPGLRRSAELDHLFVCGAGPWRWLEGFLPVLCIGREEMLLASGKKLYRKSAEGIFSYPGGEPVASAEFNEKIETIRKQWLDFFSELTPIPGISSRAEDAWKSCFVQSFCGCWGTHVKYGVEEYGCMRHDGFPPTILAAAGALREFGALRRARELFSRYLERFVSSDGTIRYYGTAVSEYGGLMRLGCELSEGEGGEAYFRAILPELLKFYRQMRDLLDCVRNPPVTSCALLAGSPEADLRERKDEYLHNNAQVLRGVREMLVLLEKHTVFPDLLEMQDFFHTLNRRFRNAIASLRQRFTFLPYRLSNPAEVTDFTADQDWAFANYRYYPELLESGMLEQSDAELVIEARFRRGGSCRGLATLNYPAQYRLCFDHWPLFSLGRGLLEYGDTPHFSEILQAHSALYMSQDIFTCYESCLPGEPMAAYTDWCVPAQLVFPRLLRLGRSHGISLEKIFPDHEDCRRNGSAEN